MTRARRLLIALLDVLVASRGVSPRGVSRNYASAFGTITAGLSVFIATLGFAALLPLAVPP